MYFIPDKVSSLLFFLSSCCSAGWYRYLHKPSSGCTLSSGFFSDLSSLIIHRLIASLHEECSNTDFFLVRIFLYLDWIQRNLVSNAVKIFNPNCWHFFRVLKLLSIHGLEQLFCQLFVKGFHNSLYFVVVLRMSTLCFSSSFDTSLLNSDPLSHWNNLGYLNTRPFLYIFQHKFNLTCSFVP